MSESHKEWLSHFHVLLTHPSELSILMVQEDESWSLPCIQTKELTWWRDAETVNAVIQEALGSQFRALQCLSNVDNFSTKMAHKVYLLENCKPLCKQIEGEWISLEKLPQLRFSIPEHKKMILKHLSINEDIEVSGEYPPWMRPGWFDPAAELFREQLIKLGYSLTSTIDWVYNWPLASILRAHTNTGTVYLKATSKAPLFPDEPLLTSYLADKFSDVVPTLIACNQSEGWLMLPDLGYPIRDSSDEVKDVVLGLFAHLQIQSTEYIDELLQTGCPDHRLGNLENEIDLFCETDFSLYGLDDAQTKKLRELLPSTQDLWSRLLTYNVPYTLVHGDLHLGNVATRDDRILFFDWGQASVSHPFFDLVHFATEEGWGPEYPDKYLQHWLEFETMDRLREAWTLSKPLSALHQAIIRHHATIHYSLEPEEMISPISFELQKFLTAFPE